MSIRSRLLLLALLLTALPALWQVTRFVQDRQQRIEADSARLVIIAQRRVELLATTVQGTAQLLFALGHAHDLETDDRAACSAFLANVLSVHPQYTGLLTIRPDGSSTCATVPTTRRRWHCPRAWRWSRLSAD
jgi:hypothetical protein